MCLIYILICITNIILSVIGTIVIFAIISLYIILSLCLIVLLYCSVSITNTLTHYSYSLMCYILFTCVWAYLLDHYILVNEFILTLYSCWVSSLV